MSVLANYPMFTIDGHGAVALDLHEVPTSPNNCLYNNTRQSLIKKLPDNVHLWFLAPTNCLLTQAPTLFKKNTLNNPYAKRIAKSHGGIPRVVTAREIHNTQTKQTKHVPNQNYHGENYIKIRRGGAAAFTVDPALHKTSTNSDENSHRYRHTHTGQFIKIKSSAPQHRGGTYKYNSADPFRLMLEIKKSLSTTNTNGTVALHPMLEYAELCPPGSYYTDHIVEPEHAKDYLRAGIYGHLDYGSRSPKLYHDVGFKKLKKENIAATSHTYTAPYLNSYVKWTINNTNTFQMYLLSDIIDHIVRLMKNPNEPIIVIFKGCRQIQARRIKSDQSINMRHIHSKPHPGPNHIPPHLFTSTNTLQTFNTKIPNINNLTHHFRPGSKSLFQTTFLSKIHEDAQIRIYNKLRCIGMVSKDNAEKKPVYLTEYNIYRHINRASARGKYFSTSTPHKYFYNSPNQYFPLPSFNGSSILSATDPFSNTLIRNAAQKKAAKTLVAFAKPRYSTKVRKGQINKQQKNKRERSRTKPNNNEPLSRSNQHRIPIKQLKNKHQKRKGKTTTK